MRKDVSRYLDKDGRVFVLPKNKNMRLEVYLYLANRFENNKEYTEKEINHIIIENHSFNDVCLLRRELIECGILIRTDDGAIYKKNNDLSAGRDM